MKDCFVFAYTSRDFSFYVVDYYITEEKLGFVQPWLNILQLVPWSTDMLFHKISFGTAVRILCWVDFGPSKSIFVCLYSWAQIVGKEFLEIWSKPMQDKPWRVAWMLYTWASDVTLELLIHCLFYMFKNRKYMNG